MVAENAQQPERQKLPENTNLLYTIFEKTWELTKKKYKATFDKAVVEECIAKLHEIRVTQERGSIDTFFDWLDTNFGNNPLLRKIILAYLDIERFKTSQLSTARALTRVIDTAWQNMLEEYAKAHGIAITDKETLDKHNKLAFSDIRVLFSDAVSSVCETTGKEMPNCLQICALYAEIFTLLGYPVQLFVYSKTIIPHVGIFLPESNAVINFPLRQQARLTDLDVLLQLKERASYSSVKSLLKSQIETP